MEDSKSAGERRRLVVAVKLMTVTGILAFECLKPGRVIYPPVLYSVLDCLRFCNYALEHISPVLNLIVRMVFVADSENKFSKFFYCIRDFNHNTLYFN